MSGEDSVRNAVLDLAKRCFQPLSHLTKNSREYREELAIANIDLFSCAAEEM